MFGLFSSRRRRRPSQQPKRCRRIQFESLERRYCLTAPTISLLQIDAVEDTTVALSGYVSDESPETVQVDFDGPVYGSTYPDASGYFTYIGDASYLGDIVAVATDEEFLESDAAYVELTSDEPVIDSLAVAYGFHTEVAIVGQVLDEEPGDLTVYFSGALSGSAVTDAEGFFVIEVAEGVASLGEVMVEVADVWGQAAYGSTEITGDDPPQIFNFDTHIDGHGLLTVEGTGIDEDPEGLTVVINFWGEEWEVTTDSDGDFFWQYQLEEGQEGWLTAVALDWWTTESDISEEYVGYDLGGY